VLANNAQLGPYTFYHDILRRPERRKFNFIPKELLMVSSLIIKLAKIWYPGSTIAPSVCQNPKKGDESTSDH
jgi:hypothetical protein